MLVIRLTVKKDIQKQKNAHREHVMETTDFEGKEILSQSEAPDWCNLR